MPLEANKFRQAITESTLRSCQLFMGLPAGDIAAIASFIIPKHLARNGYLFREGDPAEGFYVVQKGAINIHRVNASGKEQVIYLFRPVESFAEATLTTEYVTRLVPKADFVELLRKKSELALRMLGSMSQHLRVLVHLLPSKLAKINRNRLYP